MSSFEAFDNKALAPLVEDVFAKKDEEGFSIGGYSDLITEVLRRMTLGELRVSEPNGNGGWTLNQWAKQAVLLSFSLYDNDLMPGGPDDSSWFDKVGMRSAEWSIEDWENAGFRAVPGSLVRNGAFIAKGAILMPSFVNIGGYVGPNTMIDTWATVGSCAQIGADVHLSGGAGIGGVLEPLQANPVIIEDGCFIGARSEIVEGVIVRERAAIGMGVMIGENTPIVDRTKDGEISFGEIPAGAVVLNGIHPSNNLVCPQIVKYRDEKTDARTALNDALR